MASIPDHMYRSWKKGDRGRIQNFSFRVHTHELKAVITYTYSCYFRFRVDTPELKAVVLAVI